VVRLFRLLRASGRGKPASRTAARCHSGILCAAPLGLALDAASGSAFLRRRHTGRARHSEGLFEPDLCNIAAHRVAGEVRTTLGSHATVLVLRRAHLPVKMAIMVVMVNDFRHGRIRSSKKADDYQPKFLHGLRSPTCRPSIMMP
jgi:hypothetical protein